MIKRKKEEREKLKQYRNNLVSTLDKLNDKYSSGLMDYESYKLLFDNCTKEIDYYDEKISELSKSKPRINYKIYILNLIILLIFIGILFLKPTITGYFVKEPKESYVDGYKIEGKKWADIKGSGIYERCLFVKSEIDFNSVVITGKVSVANANEKLRFRIYEPDEFGDPGSEIGSCIVEDYFGLWKSCEIRDIKKEGGDYWTCAYVADGSKDETYYTIAYRNEGNYKRAFWTGKYWQKIDDASLTIRVEFRKW